MGLMVRLRSSHLHIVVCLPVQRTGGVAVARRSRAPLPTSWVVIANATALASHVFDLLAVSG